jgi:hypothetical protein
MIAAEAYAARFDAVEAQAARLTHLRDAVDSDATGGRRGEASIPRTRADPRREPEPELEILASYLQPTDVLVDVGGGSGRLGLPLAQTCREVINVEPSAGAVRAFSAAAAAAGITNVRSLRADWLTAAGIEGDVVLTAHVTYYVRDIVPFVARLQVAARRRVMIVLYSIPPTAQPVYQAAFRLLFGETAEITPTYRELVPVLWELGILPDVRVIPEVGRRGVAPTREAAVTVMLQQLSTLTGAPVERDEQARRMLLTHADELFRPVEGGFRPAGTEDHRGILVTWETRRER